MHRLYLRRGSAPGNAFFRPQFMSAGLLLFDGKARNKALFPLRGIALVALPHIFLNLVDVSAEVDAVFVLIQKNISVGQNAVVKPSNVILYSICNITKR